MRYITTKIVLFVVLSLAFFWSAYPQIIWAEEHEHKRAAGHSEKAEGHSHERAEGHGGQATMTEEFHFEVAFHRNSVQVYLYDGKQNPISAKGVSGTISLSFRNPDHKPFSADLRYAKPAEEKGEPGHDHKEEGHHQQDFLQAKIDLGKVQEGEMKAVFALKNLPGKKEKKVTFRESFKLARLANKGARYIYRCPMHPKVTSRNQADKCWVCGMKLTKGKDHHEEKNEGHKKNKHDH